MKLEEKLYTLRYKRDENPHLQIKDREKCLDCTIKNGEPQPCILVCPANVYSWIDKRIVISYENCVECGACKIACPYENILWNFPRYGLGIALRYG
ncbi:MULTISPECIES: ferredoxin family protein [Acidianus]|uniref:Ferredoxin-like protein n=1 Tax=Candidatus Acidianus copahuensis TaxID=1160895 RepID=A0A031LN46_9CREN|nr:MULTISPECIES: 4Fe-4S dicluster domain-containing protein [Acidianus]EZQ04921.1 4Fe-4S ferredoxin [Candidatus Acidianus copahuensis]NON62727.1 4Fe-4S dicluster domain-containing protein [Acidianus sp. RZ1]